LPTGGGPVGVRAGPDGEGTACGPSGCCAAGDVGRSGRGGWGESGRSGWAWAGSVTGQILLPRGSERR